MNLESVPEQGMTNFVPEEYFELKTKIHDRLLDLIDLSLIETLDQNALKSEIRDLSETVLREAGNEMPLNFQEREKLFEEIQDEVLGLGPLEPFLQDPAVCDILVNTYKLIYVEKFGRLELTDARFKDDAHLMKIIDRIVSQVGRRIDECRPMVDARLIDGSRVNAIIPPLAMDGPMLSIRRFSSERLEHIKCLLSPDLTYNDTIWTHPQTVSNQISLCNLTFILYIGRSCFQPHHMLLLEL